MQTGGPFPAKDRSRWHSPAHPAVSPPCCGRKRFQPRECLQYRTDAQLEPTTGYSPPVWKEHRKIQPQPTTIPTVEKVEINRTANTGNSFNVQVPRQATLQLVADILRRNAKATMTAELTEHELQEAAKEDIIPVHQEVYSTTTHLPPWPSLT